MNTIYKKINPDDIDMSVIKKAGSIIRSGGLVAFPTETVYGLGGDAFDPSSAKKIYGAKGRPSDNPLIVHIADIGSLSDVACAVPPEAEKLADLYWPGPLTMIFKKRNKVPPEVTGGLDTVAVRFPSHPVAKAFIKESGGFVAAPSANISGRPSPTCAEHVVEDMDGRIDMIIDSGPCDIGLESTIIDLTGERPMLLRPGFVSEEMLKKAVSSVTKDPAVFGEGTKSPPKAPGMKYRHYAPKGELTIVSGDKESVRKYITGKLLEKKDGVRIGVLSCSEDVPFFDSAEFVGDIGSIGDEKMIASRLFSLLRMCDDQDIDVIYSEEFDTPRLGLAIMNRLIKAAGHRIVNVP